MIALREAHGRGDRHIGAEHILLAITRDDADSTALRILRERNLTPDVVRSAVDAALPAPNPGHDADDPPPQAATG